MPRKFKVRYSSIFLLVLLNLIPTTALSNREPVPVVAVAPQRQIIYRQVQITGTVTSPKAAFLSPAISGLILVLHADVGDRVEAGQVLLELDPELAEHQYRSARAQATQAEVALADARRRLKEAETLGPKGGIAITRIEDLKAEVELDRAALEQNRAETAYRQALLERHRLKAPFGGVIGKRLGEPGEWVTPGQGVYELVATDDLRLDFAVAEDFLAELTPRTPVQFVLNALPDQRFTGRVKTVVPITDPGARTFLLRVTTDEQNPKMLPGMSAQATLKIPAHREGLVVPRDAILRYPDGRVVVWTVHQGEGGAVASEKPVQTGYNFDGLVEIRQGLQANERVVVRGNEALQNGQRVQIVTGGKQGG